MLENLGRIGQFLSGAGVAVATILAIFTAITVNRRSLHMNWVASFRQLYNEFWCDKDIAQVRRWIANDCEYLEIEDILIARLNHSSNNLTKLQNDAIDSIDRFCALMMKVEYFDRSFMTKRQRSLWKESYVIYWLSKMQERDALRHYVEKYWPMIELKK